jgi:hypothetical protein
VGKTETHTLLNPTEVPSRAAQVKANQVGSLSRPAQRYPGSQSLIAVGIEWVVQCACPINKGGTAVIPSFTDQDGCFV